MKTTVRQADKEVHEFNILLHGHGVETSDKKKKIKYECLNSKYVCVNIYMKIFFFLMTR